MTIPSQADSFRCEASSDGELLLQLVGPGAQEAFAEIVKRHTNLVYGTCLRILREPSAAEDALQATFLILWRKRESMSAVRVPALWLYRVAERTAREAQGMQRTRISHERNVLPVKTDESNLNDILPCLDEALAELPTDQRDVIVMRYFKGLSRAEISNEMNCPERTVQSRLALGMNKLRGKLERRGVYVSLALLTSGLAQTPVQHLVRPELASLVAANCVGSNVSPAVAALAQSAGAKLGVGSLSGVAGVVGALTLAIVIGYTAMISTAPQPSLTPAPVSVPAPLPASAPGAERGGLNENDWTVLGELPLRIKDGCCEINPTDLRGKAAAPAGFAYGGLLTRKVWDLGQEPVSIKLQFSMTEAIAGFEVFARVGDDETKLEKAPCPGLSYYISERTLRVSKNLRPFETLGVIGQPQLAILALEPGQHRVELVISRTQMRVNVDGKHVSTGEHGLQGHLARLGFSLGAVAAESTSAEVREVVVGKAELKPLPAAESSF